MEINEILNYRADLLSECKDEDGFISEAGYLEEALPSLNDAKLLDTEDYNECFHNSAKDNVKINGYLINESGERLQLFIVDESSIDLGAQKENLLVSQKSIYENQFSKALRFVNKSIKRHLDDEVQDSSPAKSLISFLSSKEGLDQIDVIEIFLVSATVTVEKRGAEPQPKSLDFEDDKIHVSYGSGKGLKKKEISIYKRLIDLNFLYNVLISQGNREVLEVDFEKLYPEKIEAIKAADEENFESYLCVLPAQLLAELYKKYSTRILEKNVRSFLQFRGVNQGIKETIRKTPEFFIAFNNGLTITAVGHELIKENDRIYIKSLKDFQIVNGGQTTASIYFSKKEGLDVSKVRVMAKINVAKDANEEKLNELISQISIFSNAQSRVSPADLRSKNEQLVKLKSLSESTLTPTGKKWYFERFKGEFNTAIRKNPSAKGRINKEFPKERRFSKEELARYYMSWGNQPYLVKKGGEKIFRLFIESISPEEKSKKLMVDRDFYEETIAKIILFKTLEKQYGAGKNAIGQLRSAVVPYTIAVFYQSTTRSRGATTFNLSKIWKQEGLDDEFLEMTKQLMELMNNLIKKYAASDDFGEYSKKEELWDSIISSHEIKSFLKTENYNQLLSRYMLSKEELDKRTKTKTKTKEVDFGLLHANVLIFSRTAGYYQNLGLKLHDQLTNSQRFKLDTIINSIENSETLSDSLCQFEQELTHEVRVKKPELFDQIEKVEEKRWLEAYDFILSRYNYCLQNGEDIISDFQKERELARYRGGKFYSIFDEIAKDLSEGKSPNMRQLNSLCYSIGTKRRSDIIGGI